MQDRSHVFHEFGWDVISRIVHARSLCPFKMLLVDISILVADSWDNDMVWDSREFDKIYSLGSNFFQYNRNCLLDQLRISLFEQTWVISLRLALLNVHQPCKHIHIGTVTSKVNILDLGEVSFENGKCDVLDVIQGWIYDLWGVEMIDNFCFFCITFLDQSHGLLDWVCGASL